MSKEKIEALYDVIVKHKGPIMDTPGKELTKNEFVNGYIKATKKDREEIIEEFKNDVPKDDFGGIGGALGRDTNKSRQASIDEAVVGANEEVAKEVAKEVARQEVLEKDKILKIQGNVRNTLKAAAKEVIDKTIIKEGSLSKKTTFEKVVRVASKDQKEREGSFVVFANAGHVDKARDMLFNDNNPMTVTQKFVEAMEAKDPKSPVLKLLYERQLKTELDKKIVGTAASRETIEALAKKVSPGAIKDVKINGESMLTYVALNNPKIVERVSRIEGVSEGNKAEALIAVANRSANQTDYNSALSLVASGAEAELSSVPDTDNVPDGVMKAQLDKIRNLVVLSRAKASEQAELIKTDAKHQMLDLSKKREEIVGSEVRKDIHKGAKAVGKGLQDGVVKKTQEGAKFVAETYTAASKYMKDNKPMLNAVKATGKAMATPFVAVAERLNDKKYAKSAFNAAAAGMKNHQPLKKAAMAIAATPALIAATPQALYAGSKLATTQALSMAYYNAAKAKNSSVSGLKDAGAALNVPKNLLKGYRSNKLDSKEKKVNNYLSDVMEERFKAERVDGKETILADVSIQRNTTEYAAAKAKMDDELLATQAPLRANLKKMQETHDQKIAALASGRHEDKNRMFITDKDAIQKNITAEMKVMAQEKAVFLSSLPAAGLTQEYLTTEEQGLRNTTDSVKRNVIKNFEIKFGHENRLNEESTVKDTTQKSYETSFSNNKNEFKNDRKSAIKTFNNVIAAEKSVAKWVASLVLERNAKETSVEAQHSDAPVVDIVSDKDRRAMLNRGDRLETSSDISEGHESVEMVRRAVSEVRSETRSVSSEGSDQGVIFERALVLEDGDSVHERDEDEMSEARSVSSDPRIMREVDPNKQQYGQVTADNMQKHNNPLVIQVDDKSSRSNSTELPVPSHRNSDASLGSSISATGLGRSQSSTKRDRGTLNLQVRHR